jgi:Uma2 family endonuclease
MTPSKLRFSSFEEYLCYSDDSEHFYELYNGELVELPPESGENVGIANFLFCQLALIVGHLRVRGQGLELEVRGEPRNRYPDLTIIRQEHIKQLKERNTIRLSMPPPLLVVEVVSPGELQHERDYIAKRRQYEERGIPEYWLVDPERQLITVLALSTQTYTEIGQFQTDSVLVSQTFPELNLTAEMILKAGQE